MTNDTSPHVDAQVNENWRPTRGVRKKKCRRIKVCEYHYRDPRSHVVFTKIRYRHDPCYCGRGKSFAYCYRTKRGRTIWQKPPDANEYLYRLEEIDPALVRGTTEPVYWCEGEKDADAIRAAGGLATSHHQGAGKITLMQACWLYHKHRTYNARHIILVADLDSAGAYDAIQRNNLLVEAGFSGRLEIVRAAAGNDAYDHISGGYSPGEFVPVNLAGLKASSRQHSYRLKTTSNYEYTGENE